MSAPPGDTGVVQIDHLPVALRGGPRPVQPPLDDRRRHVADELYDAVVTQRVSFWEHVYPMFLARDITRRDLRELVRRGLRESRGRYKALLGLFGMPEGDYRRFMNFLSAHGCGIAVSEFRIAAPSAEPSSGTRPVHSDTIDPIDEDLVVVG